jgi:hypothetical protein
MSVLQNSNHKHLRYNICLSANWLNKQKVSWKNNLKFTFFKTYFWKHQIYRFLQMKGCYFQIHVALVWPYFNPKQLIISTEIHVIRLLVLRFSVRPKIMINSALPHHLLFNKGILKPCFDLKVSQTAIGWLPWGLMRSRWNLDMLIFPYCSLIIIRITMIYVQ